MTGNELRITPYPLGAHREADGIRVSFFSKSDQCGIILYDKESGKKLDTFPFTEEERIGHIHYKLIPGIEPDRVAYQFYEGNCVIPDPYARSFVKLSAYGKKREEKSMRAAFLPEAFDWEGDTCPKLPYENSIFYLLHVRGFTRHTSSGVPHRGTFLGLVEKIPYLKELGITTVELQPAYEFIELEGGKERDNAANPYPHMKFAMDGRPLANTAEPKLNYWGYRKGFYYAPKSGYAADEDAALEFRQMVKAFHRNRMEVVMQFYFPWDVPRREIPDILLFWVLQYHVDGFRLMGEGLPVDLIAKEPALADTKLLFSDLDDGWIYGSEVPKYRNLAISRDDFLYDMRRFLKGDSDMLGSAMFHVRRNPEKMGCINYLTNYEGFTMMDLVSYDEKHNEENGEHNRDGSDDNQSWNCGAEGPTRKKQVLSLRKRQYENAISMLFLSQATPRLFMGDEFGNSQKGNNNPYCQDNEITWLDWKDQVKGKDLYEFTTKMIAFRKAHPILHQPRELRMADYISCGYPDLSYHGSEAWRPGTGRSDRQIGMMFCGKYAIIDRKREDDFIYVAFNMHWESRPLALPKLPKGMEWRLEFSTWEEAGEMSGTARGKKESESAQMAGKAVAETAGAATEKIGGESRMIGKTVGETVGAISGKEEKSVRTLGKTALQEQAGPQALGLVRVLPPRTIAVFLGKQKDAE